MKVKQAMHRNASWCAPDTPICDVAKRMKSEDVGAIPIGENDRLIGMVTDRDIALRAVAEGRSSKTTKARDVMSEGIVYCTEEQELEDAVRIMEDKQLRRLPVINGSKRLVGMLSLGDVSHAAGQSLSGELLKSVSAHHAA